MRLMEKVCVGDVGGVGEIADDDDDDLLYPCNAYN